MATYENVWKVISESTQFQADLEAQRAKIALRTAAVEKFGKEGPAALALYEAAEKRAAAETAAASARAVKAKQDEEKAFAKAVDDELKAAEKANAKEMADAQKKADWLLKLQIQSAKDAQSAADKAARGPSEWTLATKALTDELAGNRAEIMKAKEATGALGQAIGSLVPGVDDIASVLQQAQGAWAGLTTAAELAGVTMGTVAAVAAPLAIAAGVLGYAWNEHNKEAEITKQRLDDAADAAKGAETAMTGLGDIIFDNTVKQRVLDGVYTDAQASAIMASRSLADQYMPALEEMSKALEEAKAAEADLIADRKLSTAAINSEHFALTSVAKAYLPVHQAVTDLQGKYDALNERYVEARDLQAKVIAKEGEAKDAKEANTKATKDATAATKDAGAAERDLLAQRAAAQTSVNAYASAMVVLVGAEDDYKASLSKTDGILIKRDETLAKLADSYQDAVAAAASLGDMEGVAAADKAYQDARVAAEAQANAEIKALHDSLYDSLEKRAADAAKKEEELRKASVQGAASAAQDLAGTASDLYSSIADSEVDNTSKAAKRAKAASVALGFVETTIAAAKAGAEVAAQVAKIPGVGPFLAIPAGITMAGLMEAQFVSKVKAADATVTDSPRIMMAGPEGGTVDVAPGDRIAVARTNQGLRQQVGDSGGPTHIAVALQVGARTTERITVTARQTTRRSGRHQPAGTKRRG